MKLRDIYEHISGLSVRVSLNLHNIYAGHIQLTVNTYLYIFTFLNHLESLQELKPCHVLQLIGEMNPNC